MAAEIKITIVEEHTGGATGAPSQGPQQGGTPANPNDESAKPLKTILAEMKTEGAEAAKSDPFDLPGLHAPAPAADATKAGASTGAGEAVAGGGAETAAAGAGAETAAGVGGLATVGAGLVLGASVLTAAAYAFKAGVDHFIARGEQLAQYSAPIATAQATAEVRSTRADIREAQVLGGGIDSMTDSMSELETMIRDLLLPMKKVIVDVLAEGMGYLVQGTREAMPYLKALVQLLIDLPPLVAEYVKAIWSNDASPLQKTNDLLNRIRGILATAYEKEPEGDLWASFDYMLNPGANAAAVQGPIDPQAAAARQRLNMPGFAGG